MIRSGWEDRLDGGILIRDVGQGINITMWNDDYHWNVQKMTLMTKFQGRISRKVIVTKAIIHF